MYYHKNPERRQRKLTGAVTQLLHVPIVHAALTLFKTLASLVDIFSYNSFIIQMYPVFLKKGTSSNVLHATFVPYSNTDDLRHYAPKI